MAPRLASLALLSFVASGIGACSLLTSTDGLTGRAASDASTVADTSTNDDGGSTDARTSSDAPADGPPSKFCATRSPTPAFCADFDDGPLERGWSWSSAPGGAKLALDSTTWSSPPASLAATAPGGQSTGNGPLRAIVVAENLAAPVKGAHLAYDLRVDALDLDRDVHVAALSFATGSAGYSLTITASQTGAALQQDVPSLDGGPTRYIMDPLSAALPMNAWIHVDLDADFDARTATVEVNGTQVARIRMDPGAFTGASWLRIGPIYYETATVTAASCHYDNVLYEVR